MKYLKIFENFSEDEIKSTLKDLCLDLTDEGFKILFSKPKSVNISFFNKITSKDTGLNWFSTVSLYKRNFGDYFTFSEVIDVVLNIKDYLDDKWVSCGVVFVGNPERIKIDINWEDYDRLDQMFDTEESPIVDLVIYFNI
jgi:hypothetical protein